MTADDGSSARVQTYARKASWRCAPDLHKIDQVHPARSHSQCSEVLGPWRLPWCVCMADSGAAPAGEHVQSGSRWHCRLPSAPHPAPAAHPARWRPAAPGLQRCSWKPRCLGRNKRPGRRLAATPPWPAARPSSSPAPRSSPGSWRWCLQQAPFATRPVERAAQLASSCSGGKDSRRSAGQRPLAARGREPQPRCSPLPGPPHRTSHAVQRRHMLQDQLGLQLRPEDRPGAPLVGKLALCRPSRRPSSPGSLLLLVADKCADLSLFTSGQGFGGNSVGSSQAVDESLRLSLLTLSAQIELLGGQDMAQWRWVHRQRHLSSRWHGRSAGCAEIVTNLARLPLWMIHSVLTA